MRGTYRFYQDGILVGETENLLTTAGKTYILKYLGGYVGSIAEGLAIGLHDTAAAVEDTSLAFEWCRVPVDLVTPDFVDTGIVFHGQIPAEFVGAIYEMGLWSTMASGDVYNSRLILDFDSTTEVWSAGTWATTTQRIGINNLRLNPATSETTTAILLGLNLDLSGYSDVDEFRLAYSVNSAFVASMKIVLATDVSNYYTFTITSPAAGYEVTSFSKIDCVITGTPSWESITKIDVSVTSTGGGVGSVDFDGLRVEDRDFNSEQYVLVSRAVPTTPIIKLSGMPMDFEYFLGVSL